MHRTLILFLLIPISIASFGQQNATFSISGKLFDAGKKENLPFGGVYLNNTSFGTKTDANGFFRMDKIPAGNYTLIADFSGMTSEILEITLKEDMEFEIGLKEIQLDLPQLVLESNSLSLGKVGMRKIPGSVHYLSSTELGVFKYTNVNDILKQVPGVNIQEEDGFGLRPNIGLRGSGLERSARITIMEDGILAAPAPYSSPSAYYFPTVGRMTGVEVLKGASQIRFGPFTTGGAINFMSTPVPNNFQANVLLKTGSFGMKNLNASIGKGGERLGILAETFQHSADGFKDLPNSSNTGFNKQDYNLKLRLSSKADASIYQRLQLSSGMTKEISNETYLGLTKNDFEETPFARYASSQKDKMTANQKRHSLQHYLEFPKWLNVLTTIYRNDFERNWYKLQSIVDGPSISSVLNSPETNSRFYQVLKGISDADTAALTVRANNREYYSQGIQNVFDLEFETGRLKHDFHLSSRFHQDQEDRFQWEDDFAINNEIMTMVVAGTPGTHANRVEEANAFAGYALYRLEIDKLSFSPGVRYEKVRINRTDYGKSDTDRTGLDISERENNVSQWLPGVGINYQLSASWNIFGGSHKGFAPPGSNPETNPEISWNYELGIRRFTKLLNGSAVLFFNDYQNLLGRDLAAGGGIGSGDAFNAGQAVTRGIELQLQSNLLQGNDNFSMPILFSYSHTDAYFGNTFESDLDPWGEVQNGDQLPYVARHQIFSSLAVQHGIASFNFNVRYQSDVRTVPGQGNVNDTNKIPGFAVVDLSINSDILKYASLSFSITNLLDNEYAVASRPIGFRPGMPRAANIGLSLSF